MRDARRWIVAAVVALAAVSSPRAAVTFTVDRTTLNDVLAAATLDEVDVPLAAGASMRVRIEDLTVTGLAPAAGENGEGYILTSMVLVAPDLGMRMKVEPRISLHVARRKDATLLELRFEEVPLKLPLGGTVNVARMLPPLRYPMDNVWLMAGSRGDVPVSSRLKRIDVGTAAIRFTFDVQVLP